MNSSSQGTLKKKPGTSGSLGSSSSINNKDQWKINTLEKIVTSKSTPPQSTKLSGYSFDISEVYQHDVSIA